MSHPLLIESDSPLHSNIHANNKNTYANPFEVSSNFGSDPTHVTIEPDDVDLSSPLARVSANNAKFSSNSSGSNSNNSYNVNVINDNSSSGPINVTGSIGSQPIRRFANDTLDEPVSETILRDVKNVAVKLQQVLKPKGGRRDILKDWDLWGPLFLCLTLSIVLCLKAPNDQEIAVFTGVFVIVWCGAAAVTINAKLLGGNVSFFQSVCILGYCIFPLVLVDVIVTVFHVLNYWIRTPLVIVAFAWSSYASVNFLSTSHLTNRRMLAVYPLFLFYFIIGWIILILK